jgi:hypothetical protein
MVPFSKDALMARAKSNPQVRYWAAFITGFADEAAGGAA